MAHIIGNKCDEQSVQVKIYHELHIISQVIFPIVQHHHAMHNMDKWFTMLLLDPAR